MLFRSIGNISYYDSSGQNEYAFKQPYSEKTAELLDSEVKHLIDESYEKAKEILTNHREGFIQLAELLLEREVIFSEDVEKIFGPRKTSKSVEEKPTPKEENETNEKQEETSTTLF